MQFSSIRIITADNRRLVQFYELVTGMTLTQHTDDFAELRTPSATLAIASTRTSPLFGDDRVVTAASNRSVIVEFRVDDVDADYEKLVDILGESVIQKPTTMPWGNRSFLFRDPDGNLINFFTPVTAESIKRLINSVRANRNAAPRPIGPDKAYKGGLLSLTQCRMRNSTESNQ